MAFTVLFCLFLCDLTEAEEISSRALRIHIPRGISPETVTIAFGTYENVPAIGVLGTQAGRRDYRLDLPDGTKAKLLAFCPGYTVATVEVDANAAPKETWVPQFKRLPLVSVKGRLVDSKGKAMPGEKLAVCYLLRELTQFLGYSAGEPHMLLATATTDEAGAFSLDVPSLLSDPFLAESESPHFSLQIFPRKGLRIACDPVPSEIPVQTEYDRPLALKLVYRATLEGSIGPRFRKKNGIRETSRLKVWGDEGEYRWSYLAATGRDDKDEHTFLLRWDWTFGRALPPGIYDLHLCVEEGGIVHKKVLVEAGIVLEEAEKRFVAVE